MKGRFFSPVFQISHMAQGNGTGPLAQPAGALAGAALLPVAMCGPVGQEELAACPIPIYRLIAAGVSSVSRTAASNPHSY